MKKRILSILLLCCMVLIMLPTTVLAADGPMDTIPKYDVSIDVYNRTSDISIKDSRSYYIYSSVPDKLRDTWAWDKKIFIQGDKAAPHVFIDGVNIKMSPSSKGPAIELNKKASAYLYFIGKDSTLQGADGRAAIQKNRSEGQLYVLARTGTTVTCKGGYRAAGIGGSWAIRNIGDSMFNMDMYGHGVNMHFGSQSNPDYWGGTINATGGEYGAGIGAGSWGHSGHSGNTIHGGAGERLYFYSGTVNASGGRLAAGIGGGFRGRGSHIYIYGGNIDAQGGDTGAGIGGGSWTTKQDMDGINAASDIVISGGRVSARGQYNCAGIGGGQYVPARNITITGGHVSATGHYGAAIGGGRWCHGKNITITDATLNLSTNYRSNGSDAAAVGYGDIVYKPEQLVADPSIATNDQIRIGSYKGKLVKLKLEARALSRDDEYSYFWNLYETLIPDENGLIDMQLLTLPYVQNYGWAINVLEMTVIDDPCNGNHDFGWVNRQSCHVWACRNKDCQARDPAAEMSKQNGKHIPGDWGIQEKHCAVCDHLLEKDTAAPVLEVLNDGESYTVEDVIVGRPGAYSFTVSDPAKSGEASSGVKSVTINGVEQKADSTYYSLPAPDGGNNDAGAEYTVVATDNAGNASTATVKIYRRHRVRVVSPDEQTTYAEAELAHNEYLVLTMKMPDGAAVRMTDKADHSEIPYDKEMGRFTVGLIDRSRTLVLEYNTEYPKAELILGRSQYFFGYNADTATVSGYDPATMDISGNTATDAGDYTVRVTSQTGKWADGSTDAVTAAWSIGKATREAPDSLAGVAPTTEGGSDGKITGVDATMEYRAESETIYTACTSIEIENLPAGNYFVRYAEDRNHFASSDAEVTVGEGTPLAECTITFNAGGGSGSMEPVTVKAGTNYILPACGFTAPTDQEFKAWEISGTEYKVGDTYTVSGDTEIKALWENSVITPTTYTVTVSNDGNGTGTATPSTAATGTEITLTAMPKEGYHFKEWQVESPTGLVITNNKFLMPNGNVEVKAIFEEDAPPAPTEHTITVTSGGNGTASASHAKAVVGTEIRLTATPNKGYHFKEWEVMSGGVTIKDNKFIMPNDNVEVKAIFEKDAPAPTEYTITYDLAGGTAEGNPDTYTIETRTFTLTNPTKSGYTFTGWSGTGLTGENNLTVTIEKGSTGDRSYTAHWRYNGSGHSYSYYTIKATAGAGGSISPSGNVSVREGRDQTFTITPDKGYAVANVKIDGKSIGAVKSYTFENVSRTHTIEVIFMKANGNPQTGVFVDVATGSYYEDAVDWAVENGITKGTDDTHFSPDGICTRAQAVTFLWRTAGSPAPRSRTVPFTDVPVGSYYYDAVLWAVENGITKGTINTRFSPNDTCTRAQIVAFLWRSEKSPAAGSRNPFADVKSTAYYADAVLWAVENDITKGTTNTTFSPNADCTRAQIVTFLWRCKK